MAERDSAAKRRPDRRLRMHWRHEQLSLQMALAAALHHSRNVGPVTYNALRSQRTARAGVWGRELNYTATIRDPLPLPTHTHQPEHFSLGEEPGGARPDRLFGVQPQAQVLRRTVLQIVDPSLPATEDLCRRWWNSCRTSSASFGRSHLIPSRLSKCPGSCLRTSPCERQFASRSWRSSWWKCRRSYSGPWCS